MLTLEVQFPEHLVGEKINLTGSLRHVEQFTIKPPDPVFRKNSRQVVSRNYDRLQYQFVLENDEHLETANVRVKLPSVGSSFYFEKLLVLNESQKVNVFYNLTKPTPVPPVQPSFWDTIDLQIFFFVLGFAILGLFIVFICIEHYCCNTKKRSKTEQQTTS